MTTQKPMDILLKLPTEIATEKWIKNAPKPTKDSLQMKLKAEPNYMSTYRKILITIPNHDCTATESRWQSTIDRYLSHRRSNKHSKRERSLCQITQVLATSRKPTGRQSTETCT